MPGDQYSDVVAFGLPILVLFRPTGASFRRPEVESMSQSALFSASPVILVTIRS